MIDWGDAQYETTAAQLESAAERVVEAAGVGSAERVVDLGCGTGNAALAAARRGAQVVGVDPASRLLEVARGRASREGLAVDFVDGDAASTRLPDGGFDVLTAVFSVIFAPDASASIREMCRVVRPGGRIALSTWQPNGAIHEVGELLTEGLDRPPSPWGDPEAISELFGEDHRVRISEEHIAFEAPSPEAWFAEIEANHPAWRAIRTAKASDWEQLRARSLEILSLGSERTDIFRVTSRYWILLVERGG